MTTPAPALPDLGPLEVFDPPANLASCTVTLRLPIGDTSLHVDLIEVEVDDSGRLARVIGPNATGRVEAILGIYEIDDPQTLSWAGRRWLVLTDPYER